MSFNLENVAPWGRSFEEYVAMFALNGADLRKRILGCSDGPASFNAKITSCYSEHFDRAFHFRSLRELCRVAREVRVFPIVELGSTRSRHVDAVVSELSAEGYQVGVERVAYEFQKGGNEMLRLRHRTTA